MNRDRKARLTPRFSTIAISAAAASVFLGGTARGDLIFQILDSNSVPGGTGSFDVVFEETNGGSDSITSDVVDISVLSGKGISFTAANTSTDPINEPYIYGSDQNPPFSTTSFPSTQLTASDTMNNTVPFQVTLNDGDVAGAAHVTYSVAPGTPSEMVPVSFGSGTSVTDIDQIDIPFTETNGTITITAPASGHPILKLVSSIPGGYGNAITNGASAPDHGTFTGPGAGSNKLTVTGLSGSYNLAQVTGVGTSGNGDATNYVEASGFSPGVDKEIFALDVKVDNSQASGGQLTTLINEINSFSGGLAGGLSVSSTLANDPFSNQYNLFLTANPGVAADDFLAFDVSNSNDSNLTGYTIAAVAVVPEPISLGMLCAGGLALLSRRRR